MPKIVTPPLVEDDIYPNDGAAFLPTEPINQVNDRNKEKAQLFEALPLVHQMISHFKTEIKLLKSIEGIPKEVRADPETFMHTVNANDLAVRYLTNEKEYLEGLLADYVNNR